jgi:uncharacterized radical SAM protein YgiQ
MASIENEVAHLTEHPAWCGSLSDVGGPSANLWGARCKDQAQGCERESCYSPLPCKKLELRQEELAHLLRRLKQIKSVKHVRVASGVRHDLALRSEEYLEALVGEFTGGQLKLAPEHINRQLLRLMRKPSFERFIRFLKQFKKISQKCQKEQYIVPYLISAFPGSTEKEMLALAEWLSRQGWQPQQVQCFIPTPGTLATAMYWAGCDLHGLKLYVARSDAERLKQHHQLLSIVPRAKDRSGRPAKFFKESSKERSSRPRPGRSSLRRRKK